MLMKCPTMTLVLFPPWSCFISLFGHLLHSMSIFLDHLIDPTLAMAPAVPRNYLAILYLSRAHISHTCPTQHHPALSIQVQTQKEKEVNTPWDNPGPLFHVSGGNFKRSLRGLCPAAVISNQLIIHPSTGFHSSPVPFCLATTPYIPWNYFSKHASPLLRL